MFAGIFSCTPSFSPGINKVYLILSYYLIITESVFIVPYISIMWSIISTNTNLLVCNWRFTVLTSKDEDLSRWF